MFMSVWLQPGLIQSCPRDEERKRRRLLRLLLQGKGDGGVRIRRRGSRGAPLLRFFLLLVLLNLHISYPPPTPLSCNRSDGNPMVGIYFGWCCTPGPSSKKGNRTYNLAVISVKNRVLISDNIPGSSHGSRPLSYARNT